MQVIGRYEIIEYAYKTNDELEKHSNTMSKDGWNQSEIFIDTKERLCVRYTRAQLSERKLVKDVIKGVSADRVVIKCFDKVIYNDSLEFLTNGIRVSDRLLWGRVVISASEQSKILTLVVQ